MFSPASTPTAGAIVLIPVAMVGPPAFSLLDRLEMDARAPSMAGLPPDRELTPLSMVVRKERIGAWLPLKVLLSSLMMVCSWLIPPPLSTRERAPNVSSTLGAVLVELSGIRAPDDEEPAALLADPCRQDGWRLEQDVLVAQRIVEADLSGGADRQPDGLS